MKNWKMPCLLSQKRSKPKSFTLRPHECLRAGAGPTLLYPNLTILLR